MASWTRKGRSMRSISSATATHSAFGSEPTGACIRSRCMSTQTHTQTDFRSPRKLLLLAAFVAVVVAVGALIGSQTDPGAWYAALDKPPFNPPNWVFGPVWFMLYVLIGFAGWRTFVRSPKSVQMRLWVGQMLLNWIWSPVFFGAENLWLALAVIVPMLGTIIAFKI